MLEAVRLLVGCQVLDFKNNDGQDVKGTILYIVSPDDVNRIPVKCYIPDLEVGKQIMKEGLLDDCNLPEIRILFDLVKDNKVKYTGAKLF